MTGQQLKNSILQEAIEGRLVPQDPNDEPASVLLERIRAEKARLVKEKKIKKDSWKETDVSEDEKFFDIPYTWEWCKLGVIFQHASGKQLKGTDQEGELRQYITTSNLYWDRFELDDLKSMYYKDSELERCSAQKGDLLVCEGGDVGRSAIWPYDYNICLQNHVHKLRPYIKGYTRYVYYVIWFYKNIGLIGGKGIGIKGLSASALKDISIPLPPLAEQYRIVEKIESLLPKVEAYGKAQEELEKLNKTLPEQLKKSILQEAIEGRLVPQDPNDEPASVLLERIRAEKARLVKEKKIKKDKNESRIYRTEDGHWMEHFEDKNREDVCIDEEIPFDVPNGWEWCRLGSATYNHGQKKPDKEFSYIDIGSIDNKLQKLNEKENILQAKEAPSRARKIVNEGDILYATVRPYLHNMCIVDKDFVREPIASTGFAVLCCFNELYNKYLFYYLLSPIFDSYANDGDNAKGMAYPAINDEKLYKGLVPLPPLAEQHRIVEKIESLLPKIEKLKVNK